MRPLKYSINVSLDGCCDHHAGVPSEGLHNHHAANLEQADALVLGRVTYQMMEDAWRSSPDGGFADWIDEKMIPFAKTMDGAKKYVVSSTLKSVDWNSELLRDDLETAVRQLKEQPGKGLLTGGVTLPLALAGLGLIDEYEFVVQPVIAGHGPRLLEGLRDRVDLKLTDRQELDSGAVVLRYKPQPTGS